MKIQRPQFLRQRHHAHGDLERVAREVFHQRVFEQALLLTHDLQHEAEGWRAFMLLSGALLFVWTLYVLALIGGFIVILAIQALRGRRTVTT